MSCITASVEATGQHINASAKDGLSGHIKTAAASAISDHISASAAHTCAVGRYLELSSYSIVLDAAASVQMIKIITNCLWNISSTIPWNDGDGSLTIDFHGKYDGDIVFGSVPNDWLDRQLSVPVVANYPDHSTSVNVMQLGTREEVVLADGSILELSTGRLGILKS